MHKPRCLITGGTGFLGSRIATLFEQRGWEVTELGRTFSGTTNRKFCKWELSKGALDLQGDEFDVFIHCAWDFFPRTLDESRNRNVSGSIELFKKVKRVSARFIFISSLSAFEGAKTIYGKSKLEVESWVLGEGGMVVRPGLIWGKDPGGMVGTLIKAVRSFPIVPIPGDGLQKFFASHIDDVCGIVFHLSSSSNLKSVNQVISAAHSDPIPFIDILRLYAKAFERRPIYISIPWRLLYWVLRVSELFKIPLRVRSDSLLSLMNLNSTPEFKWIELNWNHFRPMTLSKVMEAVNYGTDE